MRRAPPNVHRTLSMLHLAPRARAGGRLGAGTDMVPGHVAGLIRFGDQPFDGTRTCNRGHQATSPGERAIRHL
jgi:hypothetical protein